MKLSLDIVMRRTFVTRRVYQTVRSEDKLPRKKIDPTAEPPPNKSDFRLKRLLEPKYFLGTALPGTTYSEYPYV